MIDRGEVFTNEREVKAMCDLVGDECNRIDSRFLEPACGDGNFLAEILTRKLNAVRKRYGRNLYDYERYSILAVSSVYGVDIMSDNVAECRERLYKIWNRRYVAKAKNLINEKIRSTAKYILSKNILCGDALTLLQNNGQPIVFAEWTMVNGDKFKRRDYELAELLRAESKNGSSNVKSRKQESLLNNSGDKPELARIVREFPLMSITEVANV